MSSIDLSNLEMVPCSICGKPFPKMRRDLGYDYCTSCSKEERHACVIEDIGEGDHTYTEVTVVPQEVARAVSRLRTQEHSTVDRYEDEPDLELSDFDTTDEYKTSEMYVDPQLEEIEMLEGINEMDFEEWVGELVEEVEDAEFSVAREPRDAEVDCDPDEA